MGERRFFRPRPGETAQEMAARVRGAVTPPQRKEPITFDWSEGDQLPLGVVFLRHSPYSGESWAVVRTGERVEVLHRTHDGDTERLGYAASLGEAFLAHPSLVAFDPEDSVACNLPLKEVPVAFESDYSFGSHVTWDIVYKGQTVDLLKECGGEFHLLWSIEAEFGSVTSSVVGKLLLWEAVDCEAQVTSIEAPQDSAELAALAKETFSLNDMWSGGAQLNVSSDYLEPSDLHACRAGGYERVELNGVVVIEGGDWDALFPNG